MFLILLFNNAVPVTNRGKVERFFAWKQHGHIFESTIEENQKCRKKNTILFPSIEQVDTKPCKRENERADKKASHSRWAKIWKKCNLGCPTYCLPQRQHQNFFRMELWYLRYNSATICTYSIYLHILLK